VRSTPREKEIRTTLDLDEDLVRRALQETGAGSKTELIEMGLRSLLEREARRRLKALYGQGPSLRPVRRRRWSVDGDLSAAAAHLGIGYG
jgi:Arc/MetJ family transcription regulator